MLEPRDPTGRAEDINSDLGFGSVVARESRKRFLNRDGSFNVRREGLRPLDSLSPYHYLLTLSWPRFLAIAVTAYIVANASFAGIYVALGEGSLSGAEHLDSLNRYAKAFFFSVHTLATIGYGNVVPATFAADVVVTVESLVGLLGFAVVAGLVFARFSRPVARILFSEHAIVAPYRDAGTALMFRMVNQRNNQIVELEAKVLMSRRKLAGGGTTDREFVNLTLERDRVVFFPLAWTIVHPIVPGSPLYGVTEEEFRSWDPEILILLNGFDETFSQTVHTRSSYRDGEVIWGARFRTIFNPLTDEGIISVDVRKLHEIERVAV